MSSGDQVIIGGQNVEEQKHDPTLIKPQLPARRKSSFSEAFNKITTKPFSRRRTTTLFTNSVSSTVLNQQSRLPTPSGVPKSTSFFGNLSTIPQKPITTDASNIPAPPAPPGRRSRKVSDRLAQTPFFGHQPRLNTTPLTIKQKRECSIQIEQRGLMAPLHPPLPRSSTMGNLGNSQSSQNSPQTPSFMRSTSSSARRGSLSAHKQYNSPVNINSACRSPSSQRRPPLGELTSCNTIPQINTHQTSCNTTPQINTHQPPLNTLRAPSTSNTLCHPPTYRISTEHVIQSNKHPPRKSSLAREQSSSDMKLQHFEAARKRSTTALPALGSRGKLDSAQTQRPEVRYDPAPSVSHNIQDPTLMHSRPNPRRSGQNEERGDSEMYSSPDEDDTVIIREDERERDPIPNSSNSRLIYKALPNLMWAGRFQALSDRFRTAVLPSSSLDTALEEPRSGASTPSSTNTDPIQEPMHDEVRRKRRVYLHLQSLCVTEEAKDSLLEFKAFMEERERQMMVGVKGVKVKEKQGWLQGLINKKKGDGESK